MEDDRALLELLTDYFESEGLEIEAVDGAEKALEKLRKGPRPDVILMDLRMPKVSGEELLQRLRANPDWSTIPVALMSGDPGRLAFSGPEHVAKLSKPFTIDELNAALAQHCAELGADASP